MLKRTTYPNTYALRNHLRNVERQGRLGAATRCVLSAVERAVLDIEAGVLWTDQAWFETLCGELMQMMDQTDLLTPCPA